MTKLIDKESVQEDRKSSDGVAAVDRAFLILKAFDAAHGPLPLAEIARRTGLYKSTILRLIHSIEKAGFIHRLENGLFTIGHEPLRLAEVYQVSFQIRDIIHPVLQRLTAEIGETSSFYVEENNARVVLYRVEPMRTIRFSVHEGDSFPLTAGASGKIIRAFGSKPDLSLREIHERYCASSKGERDPETASVSVPVFGVNNVLKGALTVSGPAERFGDTEMLTSSKLLLEASIAVTRSIGGKTEQMINALHKLKTMQT